MSTLDCCASRPGPGTSGQCPTCATPGKAVKLVTLKALLMPTALATLDPQEAYRFCPDAACDVVYFSPGGVYGRTDVKVPVFQKDQGSTTPVCYCFDHTCADLAAASQQRQADAIASSIRAHVMAGRCGCEVNNPQGSCCLGNVSRTLTALREAAYP